MKDMYIEGEDGFDDRIDWGEDVGDVGREDDPDLIITGDTPGETLVIYRVPMSSNVPEVDKWLRHIIFHNYYIVIRKLCAVIFLKK
ncbi:hypothetical protein AMTR_s00003p00193950 [Amborella trichopoda]|uniref:Uncharacterized protein n=1 Tax=Amborella trichopoda TaxID=13333 RepID=W1P0A0_AMBTC|nr:hypothetical protein AMTR_s00003p00193950 [Amborella trichopoda]